MSKLIVLINMLGLAFAAKNKSVANRYLAAIGEELNGVVAEVQSWKS